MDIITLIATLLVVLHIWQSQCTAQHENIPYENIENICKTCTCTKDTKNRLNYDKLDCTNRGFKHILARWPKEFKKSQKEDQMIIAAFSGNSINVLQQLPPTAATLRLICQHCDIAHIQAPAFMDVPHIVELDLAWNALQADELGSDVFRGPYRATGYEPIALEKLDLSHNNLKSLNRHLFQHTPNLTELNLSYNPFKKFDQSTIKSLALAIKLRKLDLSYVGIKALDSMIFKSLSSLQTLNLAGNEFAHIPAKIHLIGHSLQHLNLADNLFEEFSEQSFLGLKVLQQLNISYMPTLKIIHNNTFTRLETLNYLSCSHNPNLEEFDLDSLMHCENLIYLEISYCHLTTLSLNLNVSTVTNPSNTNIDLLRPWTKLKTFHTKGNLWICDCNFVHLLEYIGADLFQSKDNELLCDAPIQLSGISLHNITTAEICSIQMPKKYRIIDEDPPRFRRKRYILLMFVTTTVVLIFGVIVGFAVVCIRRRLKREDFGIEPIRYTSVRCSNMSAFSHNFYINNNSQDV